jgi:hypothetical protein
MKRTGEKPLGVMAIVLGIEAMQRLREHRTRALA